MTDSTGDDAPRALSLVEPPIKTGGSVIAGKHCSSAIDGANEEADELLASP